jgi:hypothetical protein
MVISDNRLVIANSGEWVVFSSIIWYTCMFAGCPSKYWMAFPERGKRLVRNVKFGVVHLGVEVLTGMAAMMAQLREMTKTCLNVPSQHSKKATPEQEGVVEKLRKEIESNQENTISLCTEKVLLAQQAYDLVRI